MGDSKQKPPRHEKVPASMVPTLLEMWTEKRYSIADLVSWLKVNHKIDIKHGSLAVRLGKAKRGYLPPSKAEKKALIQSCSGMTKAERRGWLIAQAQEIWDHLPKEMRHTPTMFRFLVEQVTNLDVKMPEVRSSSDVSEHEDIATLKFEEALEKATAITPPTVN